MNSELLNRARGILVKRGPLSCSEVGWALWGNSSTSMKGAGVHKNNKFCRPASKVLRNLEKLGLASCFQHRDKTIWKAKPSERGENGYDIVGDGTID